MQATESLQHPFSEECIVLKLTLLSTVIAGGFNPSDAFCAYDVLVRFMYLC